MIILVTGQPGSGKTALVVDMLAHDEQFSNRPLVCGGIPELVLDHDAVPPVAEWTEMRKAPEDETLELAYFTFPPSSVVVVDEAQRIYRVRSAAAKVPPEVAAFETHRHTGVDFILITQHPGLLDPNIRKLVGKHIHIAVTPFGRTRYEWTKCVDPDSKAEREIAASSKYTLPKRAFSLYKSSEMHTKIKVRIPFYVWLLIGSAIVTACIFGYIYYRISHAGKPSQDAPQVQNFHHPAASGSDGHSLSRAEYLAALEPRVPGLYYTAPRYDEVTKPKDAPFPAACVVNHQKDTCRCIDQQGNTYGAPDGLCRQIVANGLFKDFGQNASGAHSRTEGAPADVVRDGAPTPSANEKRQILDQFG